MTEGRRMLVFFYGLFMDEELLKDKGANPGQISHGFVEGASLRIGRRATLVPDPGGRAYGLTIDLAPEDARNLYAEESVSDYVPEMVTVHLLDGTKVDAECYNLPRDELTGTNKDYARSLLALATELDFPEAYLGQIRGAMDQAE